MSQSTQEQNKTIVRRILEEAFNQGNLALLDGYVDAGWLYQGPIPGIGRGPEGFKALVALFRNAFPDLQITVEEVIAEGDKVADQLSFTGTHRGKLMGVAPTGNKLAVRQADIWRLVEGKVVELRPFPDQLGTMRQLGFPLEPPRAT
ncbi:MAG: ester cyclase [Chloroflexi bacterium]|nr:ester cyclase [Chloroflexota bacterium]